MRARDGEGVARDELEEMGLSNREIAELAEKLAAPGRPDFELDPSVMRSAEEMAEEMFEAVPGSFE